MPDGQRQAVIVGIKEYQDKSIPKLAGSENDAIEMYQRLKDFGEFEITDGHYLLGEKATSKAVRKAISDLLWQLDPCDLALFYFSGHGIIDGRKNGYIAPYDMVNDEPLVCGISMEEFKRIILSSENKSSVVVILDCCYSGITTKGAKGGEPMTFTFEPNFAGMDKEKGGGKARSYSHQVEKPKCQEKILSAGIWMEVVTLMESSHTICWKDLMAKLRTKQE